MTKCKESIKANKQKTTALTEVKDSLSKQLSEREADMIALTDTFNRTNTELTELKKKEQEEELQMAQAKMHMHQVRFDIKQPAHDSFMLSLTNKMCACCHLTGVLSFEYFCFAGDDCER